MKQYLKLTRKAATPAILLSLALGLLLAGCEVPRPGGDTGDLPSITTPAPVVSPPATTASPVPPVSPPAVAGGELPEAGPPAPVAPEATAVEPGSVLVKLTQQASAQARNAVELGGADEVRTTDIPSLDQRLIEIGASLEPVMKDVADAIPDEDLGSLSVQATEVSQLYTVNFPPERNPQEVVVILEQDPTVEYAEPNFLAGITAEPTSPTHHPALVGENRPSFLTPNDPLYSFQWHLQSIQMPTAWDSATGQQITVAIVDTGVNFGAPDLASTNRLPGYDFAN